MATPPISPSAIKTGPGRIRYALQGTPLPTAVSTSGKLVVTYDAGWLDVGGTDDGLTFSESVETADVRVVEQQYKIRGVVPNKSGTVAFNMSQINSKNWQLAANGGTITITGTGGTLLNEYMPPLIGSEVRKMLAFQSLDDEELLVWPQVFNTGGFETARGSLETKAGLPVSFDVELPEPAVLNAPYKRWTAGGLAVSA